MQRARVHEPQTAQIQHQAAEAHFAQLIQLTGELADRLQVELADRRGKHHVALGLDVDTE